MEASSSPPLRAIAQETYRSSASSPRHPAFTVSPLPLSHLHLSVLTGLTCFIEAVRFLLLTLCALCTRMCAAVERTLLSRSLHPLTHPPTVPHAILSGYSPSLARRGPDVCYAPLERCLPPPFLLPLLCIAIVVVIAADCVHLGETSCDSALVCIRLCVYVCASRGEVEGVGWNHARTTPAPPPPCPLHVPVRMLLLRDSAFSHASAYTQSTQRTYCVAE